MGPPLVGLAVPSAFGLGVCLHNPGTFIAIVRNGARVAGFLDGNDYAGGAAALGSLLLSAPLVHPTAASLRGLARCWATDLNKLG